jgi:uncharacterized protein with GYD domain
MGGDNAPLRAAEMAENSNGRSSHVLSLNFTDQGLRTVKDAPKRVQGARG